MGVKFYAVSYQKELKKYLLKIIFKPKWKQIRKKHFTFLLLQICKMVWKQNRKKKCYLQLLAEKYISPANTCWGGGGLVTLNKQLFRQPVVEGKRFTK